MKQAVALLIVITLVAPPVSASARSAPGPAPSVSLLEAAEAAAATGAWRAQNTATITTGLIREDDKRRSAIAFAISGGLAFAGAFLWRWLPCRGTGPGEGQEVGGVPQLGYNKCYTPEGERRGFETPTKALLAAGVGLELVSLAYWIAHRRSQNDQADDDQQQP